MQNQIFRTLSISVIFLLLATPTSAAIITYNESTDGDLVFGDNGTNFGTLSAGNHTIAGTTSYFIGTRDWDEFQFSIPADLKVVSFTVSTNVSTIHPEDTFSISYALGDIPSNTFYGFWKMDARKPSKTYDILAITNLARLSQGSWRVEFGGATRSPSGGGSINYQYSITVASITSVPVPATVWLFSSGLLCLFGATKRLYAS